MRLPKRTDSKASRALFLDLSYPSLLCRFSAFFAFFTTSLGKVSQTKAKNPAFNKPLVHEFFRFSLFFSGAPFKKGRKKSGFPLKREYHY